MHAGGIIFSIRRILFCMTMLALALAPVRSFAPVLAYDGMAQSDMAAMSKADCPQKNKCCDQQKSTCPSPQSCAVQCAGAFSPVIAVQGKVIIFGPAVLAALRFELPESLDLLPLRRPPRT
jgi:hypothetical protein